MQQAVESYMGEKIHFPQVAELRPYVVMAREAGRGDWEPASLPAYDDMYQYEIERGSMPNPSEVQRQIAKATAKLRSLTPAQAANNKESV